MILKYSIKYGVSYCKLLKVYINIKYMLKWYEEIKKFYSNLFCFRWLVRYCFVKLNLFYSWLNRIFFKGLVGGIYLLVKWLLFLFSV